MEQVSISDEVEFEKLLAATTECLRQKPRDEKAALKSHATETLDGLLANQETKDGNFA